MKINITNDMKIEKALKAINGKARARTLSPIEIRDIADTAERRLIKLDIPKKARIGARFFYCESIGVNSYRYEYQTTSVMIERTATNWFITLLERISEYPNKSSYKQLYLTPEQEQIACKKYLKKWCY